MFRIGRFLLVCVFCLPMLLAVIGCEEKREVIKEQTIENKPVKKDFIVE